MIRNLVWNIYWYVPLPAIVAGRLLIYWINHTPKEEWEEANEQD